MKRVTPPNDSSQKRHKLDVTSIFDHPTSERDAKDVLDRGTDGTGFIACQCFMAWKPAKKKHLIIVETIRKASPRYRFEVEFSGDCADFFDSIEVKAQDTVFLALKGVQVKLLDNPSRTCNLPMKLLFLKGAIINFTTRRGIKLAGSGYVVNTWQLKQNLRSEEDDWFITPQEMSNVDNQDQSLPSLQSIPGEYHSSVPQINEISPTSIISDSYSSSALPPLVPNPGLSIKEPAKSASVLTKKQVKRLRKQLAALQGASGSIEPTLKVASIPSLIGKFPTNVDVDQPTTNTSYVLKTPTKEEVNLTVISEVVSPNISESALSLRGNNESPISKNEAVGPLGMRAGIFADSGKYQALNALKPNSLCHMIGVVTSASSPSTTRRGELMCNIKLIDPSNTDIENPSGPEGFQINCFSKKYPAWLPQPSPGEIVIVRHVKIVEYQGRPIGTGYHGRLQWAIYSPTTGKVHHGDLGTAPESEGLADGYGYDFSPFFKPGESVIRYCLRLHDWWLEVVKKREESMGEIHPIGGDMTGIFSMNDRVKRKHRLISEAGPEVPPNGYFDCTVEVLHTHKNDNSVYSLYVTDYTKHPSIIPIQAEWCPYSLSDYVLKVEAWDDAAGMTQIMLAGEYYYIKNLRMRISMGGYLEGKLVEPKIRRMEEEEAKDDNFLKSLLERKAAWKDANNEDIPNEFEHHTIGEVAEDKHFNCVVEVLHAVHDTKTKSCIYVTDYTTRQELLSQNLKESWAAGLEGYILKIELWDNQVEMAKVVEVGSFYGIKKLRLKTNPMGRLPHGRLGGMERLITLLRPTSNDDSFDLLKRRKEEWKNMGNSDRIRLENTKPLYRNKLLASEKTVKRHPCRTIAEIRASDKCPNKFRVYARIIDFHPWKLRDAVILHCTNCHEKIPETRKACFKCADSDREYVSYMYQLYLKLQDEEDNELDISINDDCPVLEGLKRADIRDDGAVYLTLLNRLEPLIGDLVKHHEDLKDVSTDIARSTPLLSLIINSWEVRDQRAYCLAQCEGLMEPLS